MGLSPIEMDAMTLWQFMACFEGWQAAHAVDDDEPASGFIGSGNDGGPIETRVDPKLVEVAERLLPDA